MNKPLFDHMDISNKPMFGFSVFQTGRGMSGLGDDSVGSGYTSGYSDSFAPAFSSSNPTPDQLVETVSSGINSTLTTPFGNIPAIAILIGGGLLAMLLVNKHG